MTNEGASDLAQPAALVTPTVKRKRRASIFSEQERKERKRAFDREAERSLREKTKTHIAELERTVEILRDQDQKRAREGLLSQINGLKMENERLRSVICNVKSVLGRETVHKETASAAEIGATSSTRPPVVNSQHFPNSGTNSTFVTQKELKPALPTPLGVTQPQILHAFEFSNHQLPEANLHTLDLDSTAAMIGLVSDPPLGSLPISSVSVARLPEPAPHLDIPETLITFFFVSFIPEIFGNSWYQSSPVILRIDSPTPTSTSNSMQDPSRIKAASNLEGSWFLFRECCLWHRHCRDIRPPLVCRYSRKRISQ